MPFFPLDNFRSPAALARFLLTALIGLAVDLYTKYLAVAHLADGTVIPFIPGWLHFEYVENRGAVFGIGQGQVPLFIAVSVLAIGFLVFLFANSGRQRVYQVAVGMLLAGVIGNMYDRVAYGYVRDMLHALPALGIFPWVFNIADSLLCIGVPLMVLLSLLQPDEKPVASNAQAPASQPDRRAAPDPKVDPAEPR